MSEQWTEHRALIQRPASTLDTPADRKVGHVQKWSQPGRSQEAVQRDTYELRRSEETWAFAVRWEQRVVTAGEWEAAP